MSKRAERRAHNQRIVERAKRLFQGPLRGRNLEYAHRVADNITNCSCWMCGNPRRHLKERTLAERKLAPARPDLQP